MLAQRLRHRIVVQRLVITYDEVTNAKIETWETWLDDEPAEVRFLSGNEFIAAAAVQAGVSVRIAVRYRDGYLPSMRAVHDATAHPIVAVLPDPKIAQWLTLLCKAEPLAIEEVVSEN
jgi:head-tail adaptor